MRGKLFSKICDTKTLWQAWGRVKKKERAEVPIPICRNF